MMRHIIKSKRPFILGFISVGKDFDLSTYLPNYEPNTGLYRLKLMFEKNEDGTLKEELNSVKQNTIRSFLIFSVIGSIGESRKVWQFYHDSNLAETFSTNIFVEKKLRKYLTSTFIKGALKWGLICSFFTGVYTFTTISISLYRGKSSIIEHMISGFLLGTLNKITYGVRGVVLGGSLGTFYGTLIGAIYLFINKFVGKNIEHIIEEHYTLKENVQEDYKLRKIRKYIDTERQQLAKSQSLEKGK